MKYVLLATLLALIPTQAFAGISCRGGQGRGTPVYLSTPVGRSNPTDDDARLAPGTYTLDKVCSDNGNIALVYMEQDQTETFYYLVLTAEVRSFLRSLGLL